VHAIPLVVVVVSVGRLQAAPLLDAVHPDPGRLRDAVDLLSELLDATRREPTTSDRKDT